MAGSKEDEVQAIAEAHRAAQARVGIAGAYLSIAEWGSVNSQNASVTGAAWVARSLRMIAALRRKSTRLAVSYVRLTRALETGYTLGYPEYSDDPDTLSMGDLRRQFRELLLEIADIDTTESSATDSDERWLEAELRRAAEDQHLRRDGIVFSDTNIDDRIQDWLDVAGSDDSDPVSIEDFDWGPEMTPDDVAKAFEDELNRDVLKAHDDKVKKLRSDDEATAAKTADAIDKANETSGNLGGGRVDRYGISAGREVMQEVFSRDRRIKAWIRIAQPDACSFCSMLASRGAVYRSAYSAGDTDLNAYHDHCHCTVQVRYVDAPKLPALNAHWKSAYKREVIDKGFKYTPARNGKPGVNNALNAWRRWLNQQRRADGTYVSKRR